MSTLTCTIMHTYTEYNCYTQSYKLPCSSEGLKVARTKHKRTPAKALRHENSEAVWNELALYQEKCQQLEWQL